MLDVVYVHKQKDSDEIELSIKSLKNLEHRNVYIIGDDPKIEGAKYIHISHEKHSWASQSQYADQISKYLQACEIEELSDDFIAMNDDFFILEKWQPVNYHQGSILEHAARRNIRDTYHQSLQDTERYLRRHGLTTFDFELHTPFVFNKNRLKQLIGALTNHNLQIRSLYGNLYETELQYAEDVKDITDYYAKALLSTSKTTFDKELGKYIKEKLS